MKKPSVRYAFLIKYFGEYLKGRILDVGCGKGDLRMFCDDYVGVDIAGNPDIRMDLEKKVLPFKRNEFDCIVCSHVLEHLDNAHKFLDNIVKFTRKYIIICLPNQFSLGSRFRILFGKDNNETLGYFPQQRHKWFASYNQDKKLIEWFAAKNNLKTLEERIERSEGSIVKLPDFILKRFPGIFSNYWVVLKKGDMIK